MFAIEQAQAEARERALRASLSSLPAMELLEPAELRVAVSSYASGRITRQELVRLVDGIVTPEFEQQLARRVVEADRELRVATSLVDWIRHFPVGFRDENGLLP